MAAKPADVPGITALVERVEVVGGVWGRVGLSGGTKNILLFSVLFSQNMKLKWLRCDQRRQDALFFPSPKHEDPF